MSAASEAARKLSRARMELVLAHPFFGSLALGLRPVEDPACEDVWSDGVSLGYNPAALERLEEGRVTAIVAHEVLHLACEHHLRRDGRDESLWNRACDLAVNGLLKEAGFDLPPHYTVDKAQSGKPAEAIYARLLAALDDKQGGSRGDPRSGLETVRAQSGQGGGGGDTPFSGEASANAPAPSGEDLSGERRTRSAAPGEGEKEGGTSTRDSRAPGQVRDHPDLSGGEGRDSRRGELSSRLRQDVSMALRSSPNMGDLPAGLVRLLEELARPRLDWRELLRRFVLDRAVNDYSWSPPSRRHAHMGLYLPSARSMDLGDVFLAVDTSGSVSPELLREFFSELPGILEACGSRLILCPCDAAAQEPVILSRYDHLDPPAPTGGGGTNFRPAFERVEEMGLDPACLIYLTDLQCDRYPEAPHYPVLWVVPARTGRTGGRPPFGEVVTLE